MTHDWKRDEEGIFVCRYNEGCHCELPECGCCGWNPKVARIRLRDWLEEMLPALKERRLEEKREKE